MERVFAIRIALAIAGLSVALPFALPVRDVAVIEADGSVRKARQSEFGLPSDDARFLSWFRRPLIDPIPENLIGTKPKLRLSLIDAYSRGGEALLSRYYTFSSDREKYIAYLLLRVNGSFNSYAATTSWLPNDLPALLRAPAGNCAHAMIRLLMVLDAFGIEGQAVPLHSPSLPGHGVVDAYDSAEKVAYFLDPTYNVMVKVDRADRGFFEILAEKSLSDRKQLLLKSFRHYPFFIIGIDGIDRELNEYRELQALQAVDAVFSALLYELPLIFKSWRMQYPNPQGAPFNLRQMTQWNDGMKQFGPEHPMHTLRLLQIARVLDGARNGGLK